MSPVVVPGIPSGPEEGCGAMTTAEQSDGEGLELLRSSEELDEDELGEILDEGYSPAERPLAVSEWGITAREAATHEALGKRLAREEQEPDGLLDGDGIGDSSDTDGELIDDQVGSARAGRLVAWDLDDGQGPYDVDYFAQDVGIDGGAASAEEAAIHIVDDDAGSEY
jgi:hypothetical protein